MTACIPSRPQVCRAVIMPYRHKALALIFVVQARAKSYHRLEMTTVDLGRSPRICLTFMCRHSLQIMFCMTCRWKRQNVWIRQLQGQPNPYLQSQRPCYERHGYRNRRQENLRMVVRQCASLSCYVFQLEEGVWWTL